MTTTFPGAVDSYTTKVDGVTDVMAAHINNPQDAIIAIETLLHDAFPLVKNTSGATVAVGDVGYIDSAGEFKTTTTASLIAAWVVVKVGGANNADIRVALQGRFTVPYAGSAPAAGELLVTSTTAGKVAAQAYVTPAICGLAMAAGAGGNVSMLMLPLARRADVDVFDTNQVLNIAAASDSAFSSTISGTPGATLTYNAPTGNENSIAPAAVGELAALVLWNTTKTPDEYALIQATNTGTNVITPVATITGWANTEAIQVNSVLVTGTIGGATMFDIQIKDTTVIPALAVGLIFEATCNDTGGPAQVFIHPWEAGGALSSKAQTVTSQVASVSSRKNTRISLNQRRFCIGIDATGAGTLTIVLRLLGYVVAQP